MPQPEASHGVKSVAVLDLGSFTARAALVDVAAAAAPPRVVSFPAGSVRRDNDGDDASDAGSDDGAGGGGRGGAELVGPDLDTGRVRATARVRRAMSGEGLGLIADVVVAERIVERVLVEFNIADERQIHLVVSCGKHQCVDECAGLWARLFASRFRFRNVSFCSQAFITMLGMAERASSSSEPSLSSIQKDLQASGHGLVVDMGHSGTVVTPVIAFAPLWAQARVAPIAGYHVTKAMEAYVEFTQVRMDGGAELLVSSLKHSCCAVHHHHEGPLLRSPAFKHQQAAAAEARRKAKRGWGIMDSAIKAVRTAIQPPDADPDADATASAGRMPEAIPVEQVCARLPVVFVLPTPDHAATMPRGLLVHPPSGAAATSVKNLTSQLRKWGAMMEDLFSPATGSAAIVLHHERWAFAETLLRPEIHASAGLAAPLLKGTAAAVAAPTVALASSAVCAAAGGGPGQRPPWKLKDPRLREGLGALDAIRSCLDEEALPAHVRCALLANVILCGGSSGMSGVPRRVSAELRTMATEDSAVGLSHVAPRRNASVTKAGGDHHGQVPEAAAPSHHDEGTVLSAAASVFAAAFRDMRVDDDAADRRGLKQSRAENAWAGASATVRPFESPVEAARFMLEHCTVARPSEMPVTAVATRIRSAWGRV